MTDETIKVVVDSVDAEKRTQALTDKFENLKIKVADAATAMFNFKGQMEGLVRAIGSAVQPLQQMATSASGISRSITSMATSFERLVASVRGQSTSLNSMARAIDAVRDASARFATVADRFQRFSDNLAGASRAVNALARSYEGLAVAAGGAVTSLAAVNNAVNALRVGQTNQRFAGMAQSLQAVGAGGHAAAAGVGGAAGAFNRMANNAVNNALPQIPVHLNNAARGAQNASGRMFLLGQTTENTLHSFLLLRAALLAIGTGVIFKGIIDAGIAMTRIDSVLISATGSSAEAAKTFQFVSSAADRLGLDVKSAADGLSRMMISAKGTALEGQPIKDVWLSVSRAMTTLGASSEDTKLTFLALEQMISKGKVSSEELRRQLAERMPGAFELMAKGLGKTTAQLEAMLRAGSLTATEALPAFAKAVDETFGPGLQKALTSPLVAINLFGNALFKLANEVGNAGFLKAFSEGVKDLATFINSPDFVDGAKKFGAAVGDAFKQLIELTKMLLNGLVALANHLEAVKNVLLAIAGLAIFRVFTTLISGIVGVVGAISRFVTVGRTFTAFLGLGAGAFAPLLLGLTGLGVLLGSLYFDYLKQAEAARKLADDTDRLKKSVDNLRDASTTGGPLAFKIADDKAVEEIKKMVVEINKLKVARDEFLKKTDDRRTELAQGSGALANMARGTNALGGLQQLSVTTPQDAELAARGIALDAANKERLDAFNRQKMSADEVATAVKRINKNLDEETEKAVKLANSFKTATGGTEPILDVFQRLDNFLPKVNQEVNTLGQKIQAMKDEIKKGNPAAVTDEDFFKTSEKQGGKLRESVDALAELNKILTETGGVEIYNAKMLALQRTTSQLGTDFAHHTAELQKVEKGYKQAGDTMKLVEGVIKQFTDAFEHVPEEWTEAQKTLQSVLNETLIKWMQLKREVEGKSPFDAMIRETDLLKNKLKEITTLNPLEQKIMEERLRRRESLSVVNVNDQLTLRPGVDPKKLADEERKLADAKRAEALSQVELSKSYIPLVGQQLLYEQQIAAINRALLQGQGDIKRYTQAKVVLVQLQEKAAQTEALEYSAYGEVSNAINFVTDALGNYYKKLADVHQARRDGIITAQQEKDAIGDLKTAYAKWLEKTSDVRRELAKLHEEESRVSAFDSEVKSLVTMYEKGLIPSLEQLDAMYQKLRRSAGEYAKKSDDAIRSQARLAVETARVNDAAARKGLAQLKPEFTVEGVTPGSPAEFLFSRESQIKEAITKQQEELKGRVEIGLEPQLKGDPKLLQVKLDEISSKTTFDMRLKFDEEDIRNIPAALNAVKEKFKEAFGDAFAIKDLTTSKEGIERILKKLDPDSQQFQDAKKKLEDYFQRQLPRAMSAQLKSDVDNPFAGMKASMLDYFDSYRDANERAQKVTQVGFQFMEDGLTELMTTGKVNFKSLAASAVASINRIIVQFLIARTVGSFLGVSGGGMGGGMMSAGMSGGMMGMGMMGGSSVSMLGMQAGGFSGLFSSTAGSSGLFAAPSFAGGGGMFGGSLGAGMSMEQLAVVMHGGGRVGATGITRMAPSNLFEHAPRLHKGLRPGEFAAILERGEEVKSRDDVAANDMAKRPVRNVNVTMNISTPNADSFRMTQRQLVAKTKKLMNQ